jgi:hypothetical protein
MCQKRGRCAGGWLAWRRGGWMISVLGCQIGGKGFSETDKPNYDASFYSKTKAMVEDMLTSFPNVCILRSCHLRLRPPTCAPPHACTHARAHAPAHRRTQMWRRACKKMRGPAALET